MWFHISQGVCNLPERGQSSYIKQNPKENMNLGGASCHCIPPTDTVTKLEYQVPSREAIAGAIQGTKVVILVSSFLSALYL